MNDIVLSNITKKYRLYERNVRDRFKDTFLPGKKKHYKDFVALKNINLKVNKGEILGIVGRNGAGKSTLLKIISGITAPTEGTVFTKGLIVPLLELGGGYNPDYTGRENIFFVTSLMGIPKKEVEKRVKDIEDFAELGDFIDVPVKKYSSGMKSRLSFAVSINVDPEILILDEVLSVGDELFRRKCFLKMKEFFESGKTILFVSHSAKSVLDICTSAILMHKGELVMQSTPEKVISLYHKMLNSSEEDIKKIIDFSEKTLKDNSVGKISNNELNTDEYKNNTESSSYYIKNFYSKAKKKIGKKNIDFTDYMIRNEWNDEVNHLSYNHHYSIFCNVRFNEAFINGKLLCILTDSKGLDIISFAFPNRPVERLSYLENTILSLKVEFTCNLNPGIYGIRFASRIVENKKDIVASALEDALIFRVLDHSFRNSLNEISVINNIQIEEK